MITPLVPHAAILIKEKKIKTLVIADLHIGWEMTLLQKGIYVPTQTPKLLQKLKHLLSTYKPEKLLVLGDVKHTVMTAKMSEWQDVPDFFKEIENQIGTIQVMRGNHDGNLEPLLPEKVELLPATGSVIGKIGFFHGHCWPSPTLLQCKTLVMGHVHPVVAFRDPAGFRITKRVLVKAECDRSKLTETLLLKRRIRIEKNAEETLWKRYRIKPETSQLYILPSFNDFLGGRPLNKQRPGKTKTKRIMGPVLRSEAVNLENSEIYLLDGTFLGNLNQLLTLS